jgi:hypothetical protein
MGNGGGPLAVRIPSENKIKKFIFALKMFFKTTVWQSKQIHSRNSFDK